MEKVKWFLPKEDLPPYGKPVCLEIEFPYVGIYHVYGWFDEKGWYTLRNFKNYIVKKWSYYIKYE